MTNFERIKNTDVEEMAEAITEGILSIQCDCCEEECDGHYCFGILHWLNQEVDGE